MRSGVFTQDQAQAMWDALCVNRFGATLSFSYHERMMPSEIYHVTVPLLGRLNAERLQLAIRLADEWGCDVHLIAEGLMFLPRVEP